MPPPQVERISRRLLEAAMDPALGLHKLRHIHGLTWRFVVVDLPDVRCYRPPRPP